MHDHFMLSEQPDLYTPHGQNLLATDTQHTTTPSLKNAIYDLFIAIFGSTAKAPAGFSDNTVPADERTVKTLRHRGWRKEEEDLRPRAPCKCFIDQTAKP